MADSNDIIYIRIGQQSLSFASHDETKESGIAYEPYIVNSSISMAANLREAFKRSSLLSKDYRNATVLVDAKVMMLPTDEFNESEMDTMYRHAFAMEQGQKVVYSVVPELSSVAIYAVDNDLLTVLGDHYPILRIFPLTISTWLAFRNRSHSASYRRLYAYVYEDKIEVTAYGQNRFKFYNKFIIKHQNDAVYYLLSIWKQLGYNQEEDELYIAGKKNNNEEMTEQLCKYIRGVFLIKPKVDFNQHRYTLNENIPYDLLTHLIYN